MSIIDINTWLVSISPVLVHSISQHFIQAWSKQALQVLIVRPPRRLPKATPKPQVRRRRSRSRSRAPSPRPWTDAEEQKLRELKNDQKAKHVWKVIAGKLAHAAYGFPKKYHDIPSTLRREEVSAGTWQPRVDRAKSTIKKVRAKRRSTFIASCAALARGPGWCILFDKQVAVYYHVGDVFSFCQIIYLYICTHIYLYIYIYMLAKIKNHGMVKRYYWSRWFVPKITSMLWGGHSSRLSESEPRIGRVCLAFWKQACSYSVADLGCNMFAPAISCRLLTIKI